MEQEQRDRPPERITGLGRVDKQHPQTIRKRKYSQHDCCAWLSSPPVLSVAFAGFSPLRLIYSAESGTRKKTIPFYLNVVVGFPG